jgi:hypothetical protein
LTSVQEILKIEMYMKTKGQQPRVNKLGPLALCIFRGRLAERSNASDCKSVGGAYPIAKGFESLTRRQNNCTPAETQTSTGARTAQPKPYESVTLSIRLSTVELNRRFHSDLSQLQIRMPEIREAR